MTKPSFLGLLNAISVAESEAETYLLAWADATGDAELATTLRFVAMREGEHGKAFAKRMLELGYTVRVPDPHRPGDKIEVASSDRSDLEKFDYFGIGLAPTGSDVFDGMFADKTIDPITGGLLGRYIAEERDSGRRLHAERERLATAAAASGRATRPRVTKTTRAAGAAKATKATKGARAGTGTRGSTSKARATP